MADFIYTRHARRRMRLYGVSEEEVEETIQRPERGPEVEENRLVVYRTFVGRFKEKPLKVVYIVENGITTIISTYPLKKTYRR